MITYGGEKLISPSPELAAWIQSHIPAQEVWRWKPWQCLGDRNLDPWLHIERHLNRPVRVNALYNPWGASRWGLSYGLVSDTKLQSIRNQALLDGTTYTALPWIIGDDRVNIIPTKTSRTVETDLWMLPAIPLSKFTGSAAQTAATSGLHLVPLVDDRFYWWEKAAALSITEKTTTWHQLYVQIFTGLGVTSGSLANWSSLATYSAGQAVSSGGIVYACLTANTNDVPPSDNWYQLVSEVPAAYLYPSSALAKKYDYLPLILDWVAQSVGQRVGWRLTGYPWVMNASDGLAVQAALVADLPKKFAGGEFAFGL